MKCPVCKSEKNFEIIYCDNTKWGSRMAVTQYYNCNNCSVMFLDLKKFYGVTENDN